MNVFLRIGASFLSAAAIDQNYLPRREGSFDANLRYFCDAKVAKTGGASQSDTDAATLPKNFARFFSVDGAILVRTR
jgi:hypothetical protein